MSARPWDGVGVTGPGTWPGVDLGAELAVVLGDLSSETVDRAGITGLPFLPVMPQRGPEAGAVAQAAGLLDGLPTELGPHGWRLTARPGADRARVAEVARADLEAAMVTAHGWQGPLVVPLVGPVTLAANLYLAVGDRVLADPVACDDLAEELAEGLRTRIGALTAVLPGVQPVVVLHEPLLAPALAGMLPTFSGRAQLRSVASHAAAARLRTVLDAVVSAGSPAVVCLGAGWTALGVARDAGASAVGLDVGPLDDAVWEQVAEAVEAGTTLWATLPDVARAHGAEPDVTGQSGALTAPWRRMGLPAAALRDVVVQARSVLPGGSPAQARRTLDDAARAARIVAELADA